MKAKKNRRVALCALLTLSSSVLVTLSSPVLVTLSSSVLMTLSSPVLVTLSSPVLAAELTQKPVTFAKDIAPIFQEKCEACHRKGSMAPMSLVTYDETRPWAKAIRERVITRQMPPWHLDKTVGIQHFQNDRSLTDDQISTIV